MFVTTYLKIVTDFLINSTIVNNTFCMSQILLNLLRLFYVPKHSLFFSKWFTHAWKECVSSYCWVECSIKINEAKLVDDIITLFYILNYFLSSCFIIYWEDNAILDYNYGFVYFSLKYYQFWFHVFWNSVIRCINV